MTWPTDTEFIEMMRNADEWPARSWFRLPRAAMAVKNRDGRIGVIFNVPTRDRLTVYEVNIFATDRLKALVATSDPVDGVPEQKFIDFEGMYDAGWRPD